MLFRSPEAARDWIRIFSGEENNPSLNTVGDVSFEVGLDFREDQEVFFEGIIGRFQEFDGDVSLKVELLGQEDEVLSESTLGLKGAPVIFPPDTQDATTFFVVDLPNGRENNRSFIESLEASMPSEISSKS